MHPSCFESIGVLYDEIVEGYQKLMARIRPYGTKVIEQLGHRGRHAHHQLADGTPSWAPLAIPGSDGAVAETVEEMPVAMTHEMIDELVEAFGTAARRTRDGGLDGVEIHAAHGYLLHQFLSPGSNWREDEYGGALQNRARLLLGVLEAVRANAGPELAVGVRISNEDLPWLTNEDLVEVARAIERSGDAEERADHRRARSDDHGRGADHEPAGGRRHRQLGPSGPRLHGPGASRRPTAHQQVARRAPYRHEIGAFVDWQAAEFERLGVDIHLDTRVDAEVVRALGPEIVINATGSTPRRDGFQLSSGTHLIAGFDEPYVLSSWDVIEGAEVGQSVVLLDDLGQYEAIAVADTILAEGERSLHWVTRFPTIGVHDSPVAAPPARGRFGRHGVRVHPYSELRSVAGGRAVIRSLESGVEESLRIDTAICVAVGIADEALERELADLRTLDVIAVGDARSPSRFLQSAVEQGHFAARTLGIGGEVSLVAAS